MTRPRLQAPLMGAAVAAFTLFTTASSHAQVGVAQEPLLSGTLTNARPEVGTLDNGSCTATLIAPRWIVTASHCTGHITMFYPSGVTRDRVFSIDPADGSTRRNFPIERVYSLGFPIGARDIMLMRLATAVPETLARPAQVATRAPATGSSITVFGYGCNSIDPTRAGRKQVSSGVLAIDGRGSFTSQNTICPGDSGGPVFAGDGGASSRLFAVNSQRVGAAPTQTDVYADVVNRRSEVFAAILGGEIRPDEDITMSRWCTAAREQLFYGDVNGDAQVDGICHNERTGVVSFARGMPGAIRPQGSFAGPFCSHEGAQFHVGDFNNDDRTDIFCNDRTGHKWVHFSQGGWSAPYISLADYESTSAWCSHPTAQLYIGDFNADGQSDMLCRDSADGHLWIDYSARPGSGEGLFNSNNYENPGPWCSHATTSLLVADFNGDGRSDLLCHTRSNGGIDVKLARDGNVFGGPQWQDTRANFCVTGRLAAFDMTGDNRAELFCFDADGSGGQLIISIGDGVPFQTDISWTRGAWGQGVTRPLLVGNVAASPWNRVR